LKKKLEEWLSNMVTFANERKSQNKRWLSYPVTIYLAEILDSILGGNMAERIPRGSSNKRRFPKNTSDILFLFFEVMSLLLFCDIGSLGRKEAVKFPNLINRVSFSQRGTIRD
jgi:hypothetical protein